MTSHDVVARVRKALKLKKVGHAGTLDPLATGVLVVCVGRATRLSGYLTGQSKTYRTNIRMGVETDTLDADGKVTAESANVPEDSETVERVLSAFRGRIRQIPPMYSARKVEGTRLYKLAREGRTVERDPVEVDIHDLSILAYTPPDLELEVSCSKGTYIRSLAADIGRAAGCGASVAALRRTRSGSVSESVCVRLDGLTPETAESVAVDPNRALSDLEGLALGADDLVRFAHGNGVRSSSQPLPLCRVTDASGGFWGLGKIEDGLLRPVCVLRDVERIREALPA